MLPTAAVIVNGQPDTLLIDLARATALDDASLRALLAGYTTAVGYGARYRVQHARGQVCHALRTAGVVEVLADSDDVAP